MQPRLKIFTWHIHGSYLFYLSQGNYDLYIPIKENGENGYTGRGATFPFGDNVIEVATEDIRAMDFDCILFQSAKNYTIDQYEILSDKQRKNLPRIYLEHDPPQEHPTNTKHITSDDPRTTLVHVTPFNALMWENGLRTPEIIIHGVTDSGCRYTGERERGIVVINDLEERGRRLGADIFKDLSKRVPLDLVGMHSKEFGGLGEVPLPKLPEFLSHYRFFFNPIRYTSLGLAVCEAMMLGMPVIGLATTEMVSVIQNDSSGYVSTSPCILLEKMKELLGNRNLSARLGRGARKTAEERFDIRRFTKDWETLFYHVIKKNKDEEENCFY